MHDKFNKLRDYIKEIYGESYDEEVWGRCMDILDKIDEIESEEL